MKIRRAEAFLIRLPLRLTVRHALAARRESLNLIVRLVDEQGNEGWGEGIPRPYVTGETPETAFGILTERILPAFPGVRIEEPGRLLPVVQRLIVPTAGTQSGCCAAELALFDLAGKVFGRSAAAWFGGPQRTAVRYAGVLPLLEERELGAVLDSFKPLGLRHLKIKAQGEKWPAALAAARRVLGPEPTIAVDANGGWDFDEALAYLGVLEREGVAWVEQPLPRGREHEIPILAARTTIPLMADESLTTAAEAERLIAQGGYRLFNLRLSKLGGLAAAHRIARLATERGVRVQVGCMVGETSILSAAGRLLAATLPGIVALEGSFGIRLLESDLTDAPYAFGPGGEAVVQAAAGLGIAVRQERLAPLVIRSASRADDQ